MAGAAPTSLPENAQLVAQWDGGWQIHRVDVPLGVPRKVGQWLIRHGLYARGSDFSSNRDNDPYYQGTSTLHKLWRGVCGSITHNMVGMRLFLLVHEGRPQGVVAWMHADKDGQPGPLEWFERTPSHPRHHPTQRVQVARLGHVMAFLKPKHRKQGLVRRVVVEMIVPELEALGRQCRAQNAMPLVGASDAMEPMLKAATSLPVVEQLHVCRGMRDDVWSMLTWARMFPEKRMAQRKWMVDAQPMPKLGRKPMAVSHAQTKPPTRKTASQRVAMR